MNNSGRNPFSQFSGRDDRFNNFGAGRFDSSAMSRFDDPNGGRFDNPNDIRFDNHIDGRFDNSGNGRFDSQGNSGANNHDFGDKIEQVNSGRQQSGSGYINPEQWIYPRPGREGPPKSWVLGESDANPFSDPTRPCTCCGSGGGYCVRHNPWRR